jgi:uncharacterized protein (TIGR02453 family)
MLQPSTIKFLKNLKKNNNKPWFDANRKLYEAAKADFASFIQNVINLHGKSDITIKDLLAKDCMFRINRDIRFSKDKSPYKTNFGASINRAGKKAMSSAGYYFHLEPGSCFMGGGLYMPMPEDLKKVKQEIDYNYTEFKKLLATRKFKTMYGDLDKSPEFLLSRVPKGYAADNPAQEYLRLKSFVATVIVPDTALTSKDLAKKTVDAFHALQPVIKFINHSFD